MLMKCFLGGSITKRRTSALRPPVYGGAVAVFHYFLFVLFFFVLLCFLYLFFGMVRDVHSPAVALQQMGMCFMHGTSLAEKRLSTLFSKFSLGRCMFLYGTFIFQVFSLFF